eukprot:Pgem_evm1s7272
MESKSCKQCPDGRKSSSDFTYCLQKEKLDKKTISIVVPTVVLLLIIVISIGIFVYKKRYKFKNKLSGLTPEEFNENNNVNLDSDHLDITINTNTETNNNDSGHTYLNSECCNNINTTEAKTEDSKSNDILQYYHGMADILQYHYGNRNHDILHYHRGKHVQSNTTDQCESKITTDTLLQYHYSSDVALNRDL